MPFDLAFAFIAGLLTVLAPCVLPIVPLIVGGSATGGTRRSIGILAGFASSFVATTVILASTLAAAGLTTDGLRLGSAAILVLVGLSLASTRLERSVADRLSVLSTLGARFIGRHPGDGLVGGVVIGVAVGFLWAPCVGPLMSSVIVTAAIHGPTVDGGLIALAYAAGAALPLVLIGMGGRRIGHALRDSVGQPRLRRGFGFAMVLSAVLIATGLDLPIEASVTTALSARPGSAPATSIQGGADTMNHASATGAIELPAPIASSLPTYTDLGDYGPAPEVTGITAWINTPPLTLASLRGKVVLVEFWTFACINCIHVQPYVKAWYDRYASAGLEVVGVHTPELSFERELGNVRDAVAKAGLRYPVAFDPSYATWNAYRNAYWPALYFVDKAGIIRHVQVGEGQYEVAEQVIRELLAAPG